MDIFREVIRQLRQNNNEALHAADDAIVTYNEDECEFTAGPVLPPLFGHCRDCGKNEPRMPAVGAMARQFVRTFDGNPERYSMFQTPTGERVITLAMSPEDIMLLIGAVMLFTREHTASGPLDH